MPEVVVLHPNLCKCFLLLLLLQIRVELTKFDKRTLPRGIAFLDPRPASHILHNNHGKVPVWAADGSMSAPDTISVQDYVLNKHDIVLQHPEWPCVGYKLTNEEAVDEPQTTDFITYPMEFCRHVTNFTGVPTG